MTQIQFVVRVEDETGATTTYGPFYSEPKAREVFKELSAVVDSETRVSLERLERWPGARKAGARWK